MRIEIFPRAEDDIIRQFRYYLMDQISASTAIRFREAVIESIDQLKPYPRIGKPIEGSIPGLRSWPVKGFEDIRIYYLEFPGRLRVIRVLHGERNVRKILTREKTKET